MKQIVNDENDKIEVWEKFLKQRAASLKQKINSKDKLYTLSALYRIYKDIDEVFDDSDLVANPGFTNFRSFWFSHAFPGILNYREKRCKCNSTILITKKQKKRKRQIPTKRKKPLFSRQKLSGKKMKTFQIKYEKNLSSSAKLLLNSFQNKYLYYAIDDILYSFKSDSIERDNILSILYSPVLSLQNNFSINFFDIWIHDVCIKKEKKNNKFLVTNPQYSESISYITIKLYYGTRTPAKPRETLW